MFKVVEFADGSGGGVGLVREEWLTPRKKEAMWPSVKLSSQYNKCLLEGSIPDEKWKVYAIRRIFYSTDDLLKAREKLKAAECESELVSDDDSELKGKRKRKKRVFSSSSDESDHELNRSSFIDNNILPVPPKQNKTQLLPESTEGSCSFHEVPAHLPDPDLPVTPSTPSGSTVSHVTDYDVIARHLALINNRLDDIECVLTELKTHVLPSMNSNTTCHLPSEIILPCQSTKEVEKVEEWLTASPDNQLTLENNLSLVGGKKLAKIVRRILEKVFTNSLAVRYNWTGKNNKVPLRDLKLPKVIIGAVRKNTQVQSATDVEILEVLTDWFRFAKDRDGGRAARGRVQSSQ